MPVDPVLLALMAHLEAGSPCALATIVSRSGSIPNGVGAKMLAGPGGVRLEGTVGGGLIEFQVLQAAGDALAAGKSRLIRATLTPEAAGGIGMLCGGTVQVFIDVQQPAPRLVLVGAGHISVALAAMAADLDFALVAIDDRPDWANAQNYPTAELFVAAPESVLSRLNLGPRDFVVVATRGGDGPAIAAAAATNVGYIGVVASKRKAIELLRSLGPETDLPGLIPRLRAPIGLDLGGKTPAAVALSILAEIQGTRHASPTGAPTHLPLSLGLSVERLISVLAPKPATS